MIRDIDSNNISKDLIHKQINKRVERMCPLLLTKRH